MQSIFLLDYIPLAPRDRNQGGVKPEEELFSRASPISTRVFSLVAPSRPPRKATAVLPAAETRSPSLSSPESESMACRGVSGAGHRVGPAAQPLGRSSKPSAPPGRLQDHGESEERRTSPAPGRFQRTQQQQIRRPVQPAPLPPKSACRRLGRSQKAGGRRWLPGGGVAHTQSGRGS